MSDENVIRSEKTEFYVGLFIVAGLAIMGTLIWQFGSVTDRFRPRYELNVLMTDATGIIDGGGVRLGGMKVGHVKSRKFMEGYRGVELILEIYDEFQIPEKSEFTIATSGLMGDKYINIIPPKRPTGGLIAKGSTIDGGGADLMTEMTERAAALSDQMSMVLEELDSAVSETRVVVENLTSVSEKFDLKVLSDGNISNFTATIDKLSQTTDNLANASGKLAPLIDESKKTVETAAEPFEEAKVMIAKLDASISKLDPAIAELEPTIKDLHKTINRANDAIEKITKGDGLASALLSDKELKDDIKSLVANLEKHGVIGYKKGKEKADASDDKPGTSSASSNSSGSNSSNGNRWGMFRGGKR